MFSGVYISNIADGARFLKWVIDALENLFLLSFEG